MAGEQREGTHQTDSHSFIALNFISDERRDKIVKNPFQLNFTHELINPVPIFWKIVLLPNFFKFLNPPNLGHHVVLFYKRKLPY